MRRLILPNLASLPGLQLPVVLRPSDSVSALVLAANVAENFTVPTGAKFVVIKATVDAYLDFIESTDITDLVTNGAYAADTDWTKGTGWTIAAGVASSSGAQGADSDLEQDPAGTSAVVEGKAYRTTVTTTRSAGTITVVVGDTEGTDRTSAATFIETIVAGSDAKVAMRADSTFIGTVDNFSVAPIAHVPAADQITGYASELVPAGAEVVRQIESVATLSVISASTCIVTLQFYGE